MLEDLSWCRNLIRMRSSGFNRQQREPSGRIIVPKWLGSILWFNGPGMVSENWHFQPVPMWDGYFAACVHMEWLVSVVKLTDIGSYLGIRSGEEFRSLWNWFVGGIWKSLEDQLKENLECCKQGSIFDAIEGLEEGVADRESTVMVVLVRFQIEMRTQLGFQLCHSYHTLGKELRYTYPCPKTCSRMSLKVLDGFSVEEILWHSQCSRSRPSALL